MSTMPRNEDGSQSLQNCGFYKGKEVVLQLNNRKSYDFLSLYTDFFKRVRMMKIAIDEWVEIMPAEIVSGVIKAMEGI